MIVLEDVTKTVRIHDRRKNVLSAVNIEIPSDRRIALFGPHADIYILIELLGGVRKPTAGRIARFAEVSFPVGVLPGLSGDLSVRTNVAHIARLYGTNVRRTLNLVEMVMDIGPRFDRPHSELDRIIRGQFAEIVSLCLPFDTYLLANDKLVRRCRAAIAHENDPDLEARIAVLFNTRFRNAGMIIPTTDVDFARQYCDMALVIDEGRLALAEPGYLEQQSEKHRRARKRPAPPALKQIRK